MRFERVPVLAVQWGPEGELDELQSFEDRFAESGPTLLEAQRIREAIENEAFREFVVRERVGYPGDSLQDWIRAEKRVLPAEKAHDILCMRLHDPSAQTVCSRLEMLLDRWENAQTLYFSCHGTTEYLAFDIDGSAVLSFADFGQALGALRRDCVSLVLGCCYGLSPDSAILDHLPKQISEVYGFVEKPSPVDVASLMLAVLENQATDFAKYQEWANEERACLADFAESMDGVFADEPDDPTRHVRGRNGVAVRYLKRVSYEDTYVWQGRTICVRGHRFTQPP